MKKNNPRKVKAIEEEQRHSKGWKRILILASVVYLIIEVIFNMSLLEVISRPNLPYEVLHDVEEFGRRASSTGFALFVVGCFVSSSFVVRTGPMRVLLWSLSAICALPFLLTPYHTETLIWIVIGLTLTTIASSQSTLLISTTKRSIIALLGLLLLAWPAFYHGKVAVTDHYIIDPSSGEERLSARYINLLRRALVNDVVVLEDVAPADFNGPNSAEARSFLVMLGPLALNSDSLLAWASNDENVTNVIKKLARLRKVVDTDKEYAKYLEQRAVFIKDVYEPYAVASKEYSTQGKTIAKKAEAAWLKVHSEIDQGLADYKRGQKKFEDAYVKKAQDIISPKLQRFFEKRAKCSERSSSSSIRSCQERLDREYDKAMSKVINPPIPWLNFCQEDNSFNINDGLEAVFSFGTSLINKALTTEYNCNHDPKTVGLALALWERRKFEKLKENTLRLSYGLSDQDFLNSPQLAKKVRDDLRKMYGLKLSTDWNIYDRKSFNASFKSIAKEKAKAEWNRRITDSLGGYVKPRLTMNQLTTSTVVANKIKADLGDMYQPGFVFSWSEKEFVNNIIEPSIKKRIQAELSVFKTHAKKYANGGELMDEGKTLLRTALIPPIAVCLSLFFSFLSAGKLLVSIREIFSKNESSDKHNRWLWSFVLYPLPLIIALSLAGYLPNPYLSSQAWKNLFNETRQVSVWWPYSSRFVLSVQPVLAYPGDVLMKSFEPFGLKGSSDNIGTDSGEVASHDFLPLEDTKSIREAQLWLKKRGYSIMAVDGVLGPNTTRELKKFQRSEGIEPIGVLTIRTLTALKSK